MRADAVAGRDGAAATTPAAAEADEAAVAGRTECKDAVEADPADDTEPCSLRRLITFDDALDEADDEHVARRLRLPQRVRVPVVQHVKAPVEVHADGLARGRRA